MRLAIAGLFAVGFLPLQPTTAADDAFFPLWQKHQPNAADTVLIYQGGSGRLPWTPEQFAPYVRYLDPRDDKKKWLFDGFLFIEFRDQGRTFSAGEGNGKWAPASQTNWQKLLDKNFEPGHGVPALEQCCAEMEARLGPPLRPRQVILTLPEPVENFTNWGELNGRKMDFSRLADRVAACDWHLTEALAKWRALAPKHLVLAGFYFVPESISPANRELLPVVAQKIRARGLEFFWIPYWHAKHAADWKNLGFDMAAQQPNYFFHTNLPESQLQSACDFARAHGMGLEMEFDDRLIRQPTVFEPHFDAYLAAFTANGVKDSAAVSYYEGGGTLLHLAQSDDPSIHAHYDRLAQWVVDRQRAADEEFQRAVTPSLRELNGPR